MISSETITAATVSFLIGWTFKSFPFRHIARKFLFSNQQVVSQPKLVFVVRSGLPITKGKIAAQCAHAAVMCYKQGVMSCPDIVKQWERNGQAKIVLKSNTTNEEEIKKLAKSAEKAGLVAAVIRDAGRTQIPSGYITVLGIGPGCKNKIDEVTSHLKLL